MGFLTGFVAVLCIGNYFRAKRAQERQRQQRLAKLAGSSGLYDSPRSHYSGSTSSGQHSHASSEQQHLLAPRTQSRGLDTSRRRQPNSIEEGTDSLLLQVDDTRSMHV